MIAMAPVDKDNSKDRSMFHPVLEHSRFAWPYVLCEFYMLYLSGRHQR